MFYIFFLDFNCCCFSFFFYVFVIVSRFCDFLRQLVFSLLFYNLYLLLLFFIDIFVFVVVIFVIYSNFLLQLLYVSQEFLRFWP